MALIGKGTIEKGYGQSKTHVRLNSLRSITNFSRKKVATNVQGRRFSIWETKEKDEKVALKANNVKKYLVELGMMDDEQSFTSFFTEIHKSYALWIPKVMLKKLA